MLLNSISRSYVQINTPWASGWMAFTLAYLQLADALGSVDVFCRVSNCCTCITTHESASKFICLVGKLGIK